MIWCAILTFRKQTAKNPFTDPEAVQDGGACPLGRRVGRVPSSEVFFRPEEVDRRSQRVEGFALLLDSLAEPQHDAVGF